MNWKSFTPEELMEIRNNPYVKSATNNMVRFTAAFKLEFWEQYHEQGRPPLEIMRSMGFDPQVLGESRIRGIILHIREQVQGGNGFTDVRQSLSSSGSATKTLPPSKAMIHMQHEIAYLKQELEFIKKYSWRTGRQGGNAHSSPTKRQIRNHPRNDLPRLQFAQHFLAV